MLSFLGVIAIILGACIGSFLNVVVWRLPRDESIVTPRSYCPYCLNLIKWYDNIPIISWLILDKKCRQCNQKISIEYPLVELSTALIFFLSIESQPSIFTDASNLEIVLYGWLLLTILIPLTIIDLKYYWLPQSICLFGILSGLSLVFFQTLFNPANEYSLIINHSIACLSGYLIIIIISTLAQLILKKKAIGLGDAKLTAVLGAWLGIKGLVIALYLTFIIAGIFSLGMIIAKKLKFGQAFALGPFLTFSCFSVWFFGEDLLLGLFK